MTAGGEGAGVAQLHLDPHPAPVRAARHFVARTLHEWECPDQVDDAALLASELVTNAVIHGQPSYSLSIRRVGSTIRIEVADGSTATPRRRHYSPTAGTGRGLALVEQMATAWGVQPRGGGGKVVWFELDTGGSSGVDRRPGTARLPAPAARADGEPIDLDALAAELGGWDDDGGSSDRTMLVAVA